MTVSRISMRLLVIKHLQPGWRMENDIFSLRLKKYIEICKSVKAWKISAVKKSTIIMTYIQYVISYTVAASLLLPVSIALSLSLKRPHAHTYIIPLHHLPRFQYKHTHMQWITRPSEYFLCPPPPSRDTLCEDTVRPVMDRQWGRGEGERKGMQHHLASSSRVWMWGRMWRKGRSSEEPRGFTRTQIL